MTKRAFSTTPLRSLLPNVIPAEAGIQKCLKLMDPDWSLPRATTRGRDDGKYLCQHNLLALVFCGFFNTRNLACHGQLPLQLANFFVFSVELQTFVERSNRL